MKFNKLFIIISLIFFFDIYLILESGYLNGDLVATKNPVLNIKSFFIEVIKYGLPIIILFLISKNKNEQIPRKLRKILEVIILLKIITAYYFSYGLVGSDISRQAPFFLAIFLPLIGRVTNILILSLLIFSKSSKIDIIKYLFLFIILAIVTHSFLPILILFLGILTKLENNKFILSMIITVIMFFSLSGVLNSGYELRNALRNNDEISISFENKNNSKLINKLITGRITGFSSWLYHSSIEDEIYKIGKYNNTYGFEVFNDLILFFNPNNKQAIKFSSLFSRAVDPYIGNSYGIMMGSFLPSIIYALKFSPIIAFLYVTFLFTVIYFIIYLFKRKSINAPPEAIFLCIYFAFISGSLYELLNIIVSLILISLYTKIKLKI